MNLQLSLKSQWFEMTNAGIKIEDYREINLYWLKRLFRHIDCAVLDNQMLNEVIEELNKESYSLNDLYDWAGWLPKSFDYNIMTLGYPKKGDPERTLVFEHEGVEIREGNPDWGAKPRVKYFVIKHGKRISKDI